MVQGLEHIALASPDPEKLANWYVDCLGFTIHSVSPASKTTFIRAADGSYLEIIKANDAPRPPQELRDVGIRHLAIGVSDFDAVYGALREKGAAFISEPENVKGNRLVFFTDPDGNYLHLIQREKPLP
jgi:glyoxylase I family protein